jgi:3-oxoacyl-[acyl-carrier-protein] synthase-3
VAAEAQRAVRIAGTGTYLPSRVVTAADMDEAMGVKPGWTERTVGVDVRHFVGPEDTVASMGAEAARRALAAAGRTIDEVDLILGAGASLQQIIPSNAAFYQRALGGEARGIPSFDVNSTCLSFVVALDLAATLIAAGRHRRVLIISSEIASIGLDYGHPESAALFGDGAAAAVVEAAAPGDGSAVLAARLETFSEGAGLCEVRLGSPMLRERKAIERDAWAFRMDGRALFKMARQTLPPFLDRLLAAGGHGLGDVELVIPHQGSLPALRLIRRFTGVAESRFYVFVRDKGNTIAASIPMGLHEAIATGRIRRGDLVLLCGTSAGFSVGGLLLRY